MSKPTRPPKDLSAAAQTEWKNLVGPGPDEVAIVERIVRAQDRLRQVSTELERAGPIVEGSMGQPRSHPLLAVEERLRSEIGAGFEKLSHRLQRRSRGQAKGSGPPPF